ncbi:hypothetical protein [Cryobacterium sp. PAMC25264]|uniref:hypothetical protein n=1 Tax=Cryobacterium sp. PAMC25264 TaxID=2861288 RepID=UPI001C627554|nr:hypothetical protein [Cryobacterium sp. PAMC25264]QYF74179.1 hypothetical protein KY500_02785 [Cryobacterium sp. PAMC25264]
MPPSSPTPTPESAQPTPGLPIPRHDRFANGSITASGFELDGRLHGHEGWFRLDGCARAGSRPHPRTGRQPRRMRRYAAAYLTLGAALLGGS